MRWQGGRTGGGGIEDRRGLGGGAVAVAQQHAVAGGVQLGGNRLAQAGGRTGDQGHWPWADKGIVHGRPRVRG